MKAIQSIPVTLMAVAMLSIGIPAHASKTDDKIESSAKQSYVFKTYLKGDDIKLQSKGGTVTLTGNVTEESHKTMAQETVMGLPGVKSVVNKIEVKGEKADVNSDAWLTTKIKTALLFHKGVSTAKTEVNVLNGNVTLNGTASSMAQKDLTSEYVKEVEGVKDVNNQMTVVAPAKKTETAGEKIDDASITTQVKMTLLYHRSTSAIKTKVETKHGVVTLHGKAGSSAEIKLATKLANDVNGVKEVKNRMTIK